VFTDVWKPAAIQCGSPSLVFLGYVLECQDHTRCCHHVRPFPGDARETNEFFMATHRASIDLRAGSVTHLSATDALCFDR
jgi:hypothetical protein